MLRLTAFLLSIDDIEVDLCWVGNGPVSIGRDLNKQHILHWGIVRQQKKFTLSDETETCLFHSNKSAKCGRRLCVLLSVLSDLVTLPDNVEKVHNWLCNMFFLLNACQHKLVIVNSQLASCLCPQWPPPPRFVAHLKAEGIKYRH